MIEIFRYKNKWRIKIVNETLEFSNQKETLEILTKVIELKEAYEPYK